SDDRAFPTPICGLPGTTTEPPHGNPRLLPGKQTLSEERATQGFLQLSENRRNARNIWECGQEVGGSSPPSCTKCVVAGSGCDIIPNLQAVRLATKRAAALSTSASLPKALSAACASPTRFSSRRRAAAGPSTPTSVALWAAASLPVALPTVAGSPSTSRRSSAIWNASPTAEP